jgi:hypothetical protein
MFHEAVLTAGGRAIPLSFDQPKQNLVDTLRFHDGSTLKELPYGKGRIFWAAYPVELAQGEEAAAALYTYVAGRSGITPMYEVQATLSPGVLIFPTVLADSILYVITSESASDTNVDLRDKLTGAHVSVPLAGQRAALVLIGKGSKSVIAKYGF